MNQLDFTGRAAIVTGGASGIGLAVARRLIASGATVALWDVSADALATAVATLGAQAHAFPLDITDEAAVGKVFADTAQRLGKVDALVNSAGITGPNVTTWEYPADAWRRVFEVNVTGTFLCSQVMGQGMIQAGGGKIINVSSVYGSVGTRSEVMDAIAYNTSKGAIEAFTRDLAVKWAKYHVHVNAIAPAFFETDMTRYTMEKAGEHILSHVPLGRFGKAEDLKGAVVFLGSRASDYVTGSTLFVDGGYRAV